MQVAGRALRIAVHDYPGHPFPVELSRELARRGHDVLHLYSAAITTPRGALSRTPDDPAGFAVEPIALWTAIDRDQLFSRRRLEAEHGRRVATRLRGFEPDVVLSGNAPLEAQQRIAGFCLRTDTAFVFWVQDLIGEAAKRLLSQRLSVLGPLVARHYQRLERRLLRQADAVVVISEDFRPYIPRAAEVIENWGPLRELPLRPRVNPWSTAHGLDTTTNLIYSGTLGMKHDPGILVRIAAGLPDEDARVVVVSEGSAADWLQAQARESKRRSLVVLPFQPYEALPDVHATADVLIAILEPEAGVFSVPSKVLSYLCAGRAVLLIVPSENLAARIVQASGAGLVVSPTDEEGLQEALARLLGFPAERAEMGARARSYAEQTFDLSVIADRFESVLGDAHAHALARSLGRRSRRRAESPVVEAHGATDDRSGGNGMPSPRISVLIVTYNSHDEVERCLQSLEQEARAIPLQVVVVDNDSRDSTVSLVENAFPWVELIRNSTNAGFARAVNRALAKASGDYVLLLNPDTVVPPGALAASVAELERHPDVGMLGCKLVQRDGTFDHACKRGLPSVASALYYALGLQRLFPRSPRFAAYTAGHLDEDSAGPVDAVNGAFMLARREAVMTVGGLDERFWLYGEDLDWCLRFAEHGYGIRYWPEVEVLHLKGASAGGRRTLRTTYAFHRSMWNYYEKHLADEQLHVVGALVWVGIWSRFLVVAAASAARRPGHRRAVVPVAPRERTSP
jgi:GT2 family glycosyltransferase/glycosyltransferase involved in cell wall biosynthesis